MPFFGASAEVVVLPLPPLRLVLLTAAVAVALGAPTATTATARPEARAASSAPTPPLATAEGIRAARRYARSRAGTVAFAVLDGQGRLRGLNRTVAFPSASVVKAMLMVSVLRAAGRRPLDGAMAKTLTSMITVSDNDAASAVYRRVGAAGLYRVAHAANMRYFRDVGWWASARLTAADQARFFYRIDRLVPAAHRRFARTLLSSITGSQRWGIPPVAARHGLRAFFKGGWRTAITHQVALLEKGGRRIALAVFTSGEPSHGLRGADHRGHRRARARLARRRRARASSGPRGFHPRRSRYRGGPPVPDPPPHRPPATTTTTARSSPSSSPRSCAPRAPRSSTRG